MKTGLPRDMDQNPALLRPFRDAQERAPVEFGEQHPYLPLRYKLEAVYAEQTELFRPPDGLDSLE